MRLNLIQTLNRLKNTKMLTPEGEEEEEEEVDGEDQKDESENEAQQEVEVDSREMGVEEIQDDSSFPTPHEVGAVKTKKETRPKNPCKRIDIEILNGYLSGIAIVLLTDGTLKL